MVADAWWKFLTRIVTSVVLISWVALFGLYVFLGDRLDNVEGKVAPVVTGTVVFDHRPAYNEKFTQVRLQFIKIRACDPKALVIIKRLEEGPDEILVSRFLSEQRLGSNDGELTRERRMGLNRTGWLEVEEPYELAATNTYVVEVMHECHKMWRTKTVMYVGPLAPRRNFVPL
jgi:hypothetical protein